MLKSQAKLGSRRNRGERELRGELGMEGHDSPPFAGKNQPPPGEPKYCKSLKERQNLKDERLPQLRFAGSHSLPFIFLIKTEILQGIVELAAPWGNSTGVMGREGMQLISLAAPHELQGGKKTVMSFKEQMRSVLIHQ